MRRCFLFARLPGTDWQLIGQMSATDRPTLRGTGSLSIFAATADDLADCYDLEWYGTPERECPESPRPTDRSDRNRG